MVIEESVLIGAEMDRVWETFTDLACWLKWSRSVLPPPRQSGRLKEGRRFRLCIRPFAFPVHFEPRVQEVAPCERVVWQGRKYGLLARHEFLFEETGAGVLLTSRETFAGPLMPLLALLLPLGRIRALTASMLRELKDAAEA